MNWEMVAAGAVVGWALGLAVTLAWDTWRNPKSGWSAAARADIETAKARELERRRTA